MMDLCSEKMIVICSMETKGNRGFVSLLEDVAGVF